MHLIIAAAPERVNKKLRKTEKQKNVLDKRLWMWYPIYNSSRRWRDVRALVLVSSPETE